MELKWIPENLPSPFQFVEFESLVYGKWKGFVKRDDLIHPRISGNKWRKLAGYMKAIHPNQILTTFGGPHSNHLYATAWACSLNNIQAKAIIPNPFNHNHNAILQELMEKSVELYFVERSMFNQFRRSNPTDVCSYFGWNPGNHFFVPFGGDGDRASFGLNKIVTEVLSISKGPFNWIIPIGTGCTAEGILKRAGKSHSYTFYAPFKRKPILSELYQRFAKYEKEGFHIKWLDGPKFKFGKIDQEVKEFNSVFLKQTKIQLDLVYNGPLMHHYLKSQNSKSQEDRIDLLLHTGGVIN